MRTRSSHSGLWQPRPDKAAFPRPAGSAERQDPGGRCPAGRERPIPEGAVLSGMCRLHTVNLRLGFTSEDYLTFGPGTSILSDSAGQAALIKFKLSKGLGTV